MINIRFLLIISFFSIHSGFAQKLPKDFETIEFNAKKIVFTESLGDLTRFQNQEDYDRLWRIFDTAYTVEIIKNTGFNEYSSVDEICFIKVEYKRKEKLPDGNIRVNDYALDNLYILGVTQARAMKFYKLKGFIENDFKQFAYDLPKAIPYSYRTLIKEKFILELFSIEFVDLECLYYKYIKGKKRDCDVPNKIRNAELFYR